MNKIAAICAFIFAIVLAACPSYTVFDLSSGKMTVQEAKGYKSKAPYLAVAIDSKHYMVSNSTTYFFYDGKLYGANGNENELLNPGETVIYKIKVGNYGEKPVQNVNAVISTNDEFITNMINYSGFIGNFLGRGSYSADTKYIFDNEDNLFTFTVSPAAPLGHIIRFDIEFYDANGNTWEDYFLFTIY